jgi:hypothetical protein
MSWHTFQIHVGVCALKRAPKLILWPTIPLLIIFLHYHCTTALNITSEILHHPGSSPSLLAALSPLKDVGEATALNPLVPSDYYSIIFFPRLLKFISYFHIYTLIHHVTSSHIFSMMPCVCSSHCTTTPCYHPASSLLCFDSDIRSHAYPSNIQSRPWPKKILPATTP